MRHAFLGPPAPSLLALWPALPGALAVALLRVRCLAAFGRLGASLALRLHGRSWTGRLAPGAPEEFAERCFYALAHTLCTLVGGWACWSHGWLTEPGAALFFVLPWPHALPAAQLARARWYFVLESAFALESAFNLARAALVQGVARERMMLAHHAVTLLLIGASWSLIGLPETGAVVLWLHAASDIGIDVLKAADALAWGAALAPCFALALVGWVGLRFVYLPLHLLWPGALQIHRSALAAKQDCAPYPECGRLAWRVPECLPGCACFGGLLALLAMHAIWLRRLLAKAARALRPAAAGAPVRGRRTKAS